MVTTMALNLVRHKNLTVALLLSDLQDAQEISRVFRKVGILPHVYEDLATFWQGVLVNTPAICLIDVTLMSQDNLVLKMHPLVKSGDLPTSFFYTEKTKPLVFSTHDIFNVGLIEKTSSYEGPIKSLLKRLNRIISLETQNQDLKIENQKFSTQVSKLMQERAGLKESEYYEDIYNHLSGKFDFYRDRGDFLEVFEAILDGWDEVSEFSAMELSPNGQKLISINSFHEKFKRLPILWTGQTCLEGIDLSAQDLAAGAALDILGGEIMALALRGASKNPDILLYVKVNDPDFLAGFPWNKLERFLCGIYASFELKKVQGVENNDQVITPHELLSFIDRFRFGRKPGEKIDVRETKYKLININFSDMIDLVLASPAQRFHFQEFFKDFFGKINRDTSFDFRISCNGVENIGILTTESQADALFEYLNGYILRYPFWKFFDNADVVLSRKMRPALKFSPLSSTAYLNLLTEIQFQADEDIVKEEAKERTRRMIWGDAPQDSM